MYQSVPCTMIYILLLILHTITIIALFISVYRTYAERHCMERGEEGVGS